MRTIVSMGMSERALCQKYSKSKTGQLSIFHVYDRNLGPQGIEVFFDLPGFGPFVNLALESVLGAFLFDSSLQTLEAPAEDCVLTGERS